MFGELRGKTGHDFLIWKVKRRVGNYMPKPACCCQADSALTSTNVYRYDYNLVPQLYFIVCLYIRMLPKQSLNVIRNMNVIK